MSAADPNRNALVNVARQLGPLRERIVFVGGATVGLLITDAAAPPIRPTDDVDVVVEVTSLSDYQHRLRAELLARGFAEDSREGAPICRWVCGKLTVDIVPSVGQVIGFSNRWYPSAMETAKQFELDDGLHIRLVDAPHFLGTKIEAFRDRGAGDYLASHDLEDFVAVVDGRTAIVDEVSASTPELREFLGKAAVELLESDVFRDEAVIGHLAGDDDRADVVLERLSRIRSVG